MQEHIAVRFLSIHVSISNFCQDFFTSDQHHIFRVYVNFWTIRVTRAVRFSDEFVPGLRMLLNKTRVTFYEIVHRSNDVFTIERLNA